MQPASRGACYCTGGSRERAGPGLQKPGIWNSSWMWYTFADNNHMFAAKHHAIADRYNIFADNYHILLTIIIYLQTIIYICRQFYRVTNFFVKCCINLEFSCRTFRGFLPAWRSSISHATTASSHTPRPPPARPH